MRIALANSTFWQQPASTETAESTPELNHAQKKVDDAVLKEDARNKIAEEKKAKKSQAEIIQEETKRYEGVQSVYEIKQRADADKYLRFAWRKTLKDAEADVKRLEKAVKELEAKPSPTREDAEKLTNLLKERTAAVAWEADARIHYTAKTMAIEVATRRVYETYPPVITKDIALLATEIIEIANDSSLESLIDSIPADEWYEAKDKVITILEPCGAEGLETSKLERGLRKHGLKDSYARLIAELRFENRIEICNDSGKRRSPNGGFRLRIPQAPPEPDELS